MLFYVASDYRKLTHYRWFGGKDIRELGGPGFGRRGLRAQPGWPVPLDGRDSIGVYARNV